MFVLRIITAKYALLRVKNEEQICSQLTICSLRQIHCIMTKLNKLFNFEFERSGTEKEPSFLAASFVVKNCLTNLNCIFIRGSLWKLSAIT